MSEDNNTAELARRIALACIPVLFVVGVPAEAAERSDLRERYRIVVSEDVYPQAKPREAIYSIIDAIENGNARYVLAHLVSPREVDDRLRHDARAFEELVSMITPKKAAPMIDQLSAHLNEGNWTIGSRYATSQLDGMPDLSLERIGNRWFMHNVPRKRASNFAQQQRRSLR